MKIFVNMPGSDGVVIVFDLTAEKSLRDAREWLRMARTNCGKGMPTIVLGNKVDLVKEDKEVNVQSNKDKESGYQLD